MSSFSMMDSNHVDEDKTNQAELLEDANANVEEGEYQAELVEDANANVEEGENQAELVENANANVEEGENQAELVEDANTNVERGDIDNRIDQDHVVNELLFDIAEEVVKGDEEKDSNEKSEELLFDIAEEVVKGDEEKDPNEKADPGDNVETLEEVEVQPMREKDEGAENIIKSVEEIEVQPMEENDEGVENIIETVEEVEVQPMEEDDEGVEYIVEKILDKKIDSNGFARYLVKWEGYPSSANSWEPLEHLVDCDGAMQRYELMRAEKLSRKYEKGEAAASPLGKSKTNGVKEYEVDQIMGLTLVNKEKYFMLNLKNESRPTFLRASLANKIFPDKVIDYYMKHLEWKPKSSTSSA